MNNDYELIYFYRMKCEESTELLIKKYNVIIWSIIHSFNIQYYQSDLEDIHQLCLAELLNCLDRYIESSKATFKTYFYHCAKTRILNFLNYENNKSLVQIKVALSLNNCVCEDSSAYLEEVIADPQYSKSLLLEYDIAMIESQILDECSFIENKIWELRKLGFTYEEIGIQCNISEKKVDNTIRKISRLIKKRY